MGNLTISVVQCVEFLKQQEFSFMKRIKSIQFTPNKINVKTKLSILRPNISVALLSYQDGILHLDVDTNDFIETLVKIFFGIKAPTDEVLKKEKLNRFIKRVKDKNLEFQVDIPEFLESLKIQGLNITNIEIKRKNLVIDFAVDDS